MNLFVKAFGVGLILFGEALAININQYRECFSLFKGSLSTSMIDICNCFKTTSLESAFNDGFRKGRPQP